MSFSLDGVHLLGKSPKHSPHHFPIRSNSRAEASIVGSAAGPKSNDDNNVGERISPARHQQRLSFQQHQHKHIAPRTEIQTTNRPTLGAVCGRRAPTTDSVPRIAAVAATKSSSAAAAHNIVLDPAVVADAIQKEEEAEEAAQKQKKVLLPGEAEMHNKKQQQQRGEEQGEEDDATVDTEVFDSDNEATLISSNSSSVVQQQPNNKNDVSVLSGYTSTNNDSDTRTSLPRKRSNLAALKKFKSAVEETMAEKRKRFDARRGISEALYGRLIPSEAHGSAVRRSVVRPSDVAKLTHGWVSATSAGTNHEAISLLEFLSEENERVTEETRERDRRKKVEEEQLAASLLVSPIKRAAHEDFHGLRAEQQGIDQQLEFSHKAFSPKKVSRIGFGEKKSDPNIISATNSRSSTAAATISAHESGRDVQFRMFMASGKLPPMPVGETRLSLLLSTRLQQFKLEEGDDDDDDADD